VKVIKTLVKQRQEVAAWIARQKQNQVAQTG
jgi:hypothetical protein